MAIGLLSQPPGPSLALSPFRAPKGLAGQRGAVVDHRRSRRMRLALYASARTPNIRLPLRQDAGLAQSAVEANWPPPTAPTAWAPTPIAAKTNTPRAPMRAPREAEKWALTGPTAVRARLERGLTQTKDPQMLVFCEG
jgi:hypothetical protein